MFVFPLIATLVSLIFSGLVFRQYIQRERPFQLAWAVALLMFGVASLAETIGLASGWTETIVKLWYLFGAVLVVGYLALGSLYIHDAVVAGRLLIIGVVLAMISVFPIVIFSKTALGAEKLQAGLLFAVIFSELLFFAVRGRENIAKIWLINLMVGTVGGLLMTVMAPVDAPRIAADGWEAINRSLFLKGTAVSINTIGGVILIGGALYSGWVLWQKKIMRERAIGTILIGVGALFPSIGGFAHGYFQAAGQAVLSVSLTVGVAIMFLGFLETGRQSGPPKANVASPTGVAQPTAQ